VADAPDALSALRGLYGAGLLLAPRWILAALARVPLDRRTVAVVRVLGARQLAQAAVVGRRPTPARRLAGAAVDAAHAASMVAVARWSPCPAHRVLAARQARTAGLLAVAGAVGGRRRGRPQPAAGEDHAQAHDPFLPK
jgi:hypothetical protein